MANPGDEIIIPNPCFSTYISVLKFLGVNIVGVPLLEENGFRMNPDDVKKAISKNTKMIVINSPNNPTGSMMHQNELDEIAKLAYANGIYLYLDEIYRALVYDETRMYSPSVIDQCKEFTIVADGFSKAYAMTGWRLGYAIAPEKLISKMALLLETIASCTPPFVQNAGIAALKNADDYVSMMVLTYKKRRDVLVEGLNSIEGITCQIPQGAFYAFANVKGMGMSDIEFSNVALEKCNVGTTAGSYFGEAGKGYVRFCYATSEERIKEGVERLRRFRRER